MRIRMGESVRRIPWCKPVTEGISWNLQSARTSMSFRMSSNGWRLEFLLQSSTRWFRFVGWRTWNGRSGKRWLYWKRNCSPSCREWDKRSPSQAFYRRVVKDVWNQYLRVGIICDSCWIVDQENGFVTSQLFEDSLQNVVIPDATPRRGVLHGRSVILIQLFEKSFIARIFRKTYSHAFLVGMKIKVTFLCQEL